MSMFEFFISPIAKQNICKTAVFWISWISFFATLIENHFAGPPSLPLRVIRGSSKDLTLQLGCRRYHCGRVRILAADEECARSCIFLNVFGGVMFLEAMTYWDGRVLRYHVKAVVVMRFRWKHGSLGVLRPASAEAAATCPNKNAKKWNGRSNIYLYTYCKWIDINIIRSTSIIKCALLWLLMDAQFFFVSMLNSGEKSSLDLR